MEKFRWAYIGCGSIANHTAENITKGSHVIAAVYGRNKEKVKKFASKYNAAVCDSAEEAMDPNKIDGVYIATPHTSHVEYAVKSLQRKIPVLCEKPVGVSIKDVERIIDCAEENDTYFTEAMWTWFSDVALKVKEWVKSGKIGEVSDVEIHYAFPGLLQKRTSRLRMPETAGGALLDIGIYPLTYCYNLFGNPDKIECSGKLKDGIDVGEEITLYYGKTKCRIFTSLSTLRESCVIKGEKGTISLPLFHMASKAVLKAGQESETFNGKTDYLTEFTRVAEEIRSGKKQSDYVPFSATKAVMEMMDECRRQMGLVYPFEKQSV